jgi:signal transduction histidine kinase
VASRSVVLVVHRGEPPMWAAGLEAGGSERREVVGDVSTIASALEGVDVVLLDSRTSVAALARRIHEMAPAVQTAVIVRADEYDAMRRSILFAPGVGELWVIQEQLIDGGFIKRAADVTRQRQRYERTRPSLAVERSHARADGIAEERTIISEAFLAGLLKVLPDPIFTVDQRGLVLSSNDAADRLLESAGPEARRHPLWDLLHPSIAIPLDPAEVETVSFQAERHGPGGAHESWDVLVAPIRAGEVRAWAIIARDLTDHFRVQNQLEEQGVELQTQAAELEMQKLELAERAEAAERALDVAERAQGEANAANAAKSQFLATMSHELRTPLNAIIGYAQLLQLQVDPVLNEAQRMYLARLQASGGHLLGLINDILDLSKIEAGGMVVRAENQLAREVVSATTGILAPSAEQRKVTLVADANGDEVMYTGDIARVRQVIVNLLSNAVKFTDAGGRVTVTWDLGSAGEETRLTGDGPWMFIRVSDTGIGIPTELQSSVFDPFVQVEGGRTRETGGTGLGLAISLRLARLMGGDITLRSTPGVGSTFTLWLPAPDSTRGELQSPAARAARARRGAPSVRALGLRDTGRMIRTELEAILESFVARLRSDAMFVDVRHLQTEMLEDHVSAFLADLAQALIVADDSGDLETDAMRDGSKIHHVIAERHGRQRLRIGFTEAQVVREYALLMEELEARIERQDRGNSGDDALALGLLRRLVLESRKATVAAMGGSTKVSGH